MKPDPCAVVARPSARLVARVDPEAAAWLAARKAEGAGASIGAIRRIPTALIVCAALGVAGVSVPPLLAAVQPGQAVRDWHGVGVRHGATLRGDEVAVPAPAGGLIFAPAVLMLGWLRRGTRRQGLRNAGAVAPHRGRHVPADGETPCVRGFRCPFLDVSSLKLAGRGVPRRVRRLFAGRA